MILLTADIHIKLGQKHVPKRWALKRYGKMFAQLNEASLNCNLQIVPGDIFDRVPTLEELQVYFDWISTIKTPTYLSTGNHEATKKGKSFFTELKHVTEDLNPLVKVIVDEIYSTDQFHIVPYEFIKKKSTWDNLSPLPVFTHVRGEIPPHVKPEINLDWLNKFPVVFAGDLHSHSNTQRNIVYPGSPVTTSFHRTETDTGYILIDESDWSWEWKKLDVPQLLKKKVTSEADMKPDPYHNVMYELVGDLESLASAEDNELLAKKVVSKNTEVKLLLEDLQLDEELVKYFKEVQNIEDPSNLMETYYEYSNL